MDLVGPSISFLLNKGKLRPTENDVLKFAIKAIRLIEHLHHIGFLYKDMKLANFCVSLNNNKDIYLIDYGISG